MTGPAFDRVCSAFESAGLAWTDRGSGVATAQAPGHSAADRSVSVRATVGQVLVHSFADPVGVVMEAVGLTYRDLYDDPKGVTYDYPDGRRVHRDPDKRFRQSGSTKPGPAGAALYRSDRIADAGTVYVVEGEKDCHAMESIGAVAVSTPMGAGKAHRCDLTPLHGRSVVIVRDKDDAGAKHAAQLVELLAGHVESLTVVEAKNGKDAADHIAAGCGLGEFVSSDSVPVPGAGRRLELVPFSQVEARPVDWLWRDWIPHGYITLLAGREGIGKSTFATWIAAHVTNGSLDTTTQVGRNPAEVLYVSTEDDPARTVAPRLEAAGADLNRVHLLRVTFDGEDTGATMTLPGDLDELERLIERHGIRFVVLDAAKSVMDPRIDGYNDRQVRGFLEPVQRSAGRLGFAVLGVVHLGKAATDDPGKAILGSIAWSQVVRQTILGAKRQDGSVVVSVEKSNLTGNRRAACYTIAAHVPDPMRPADTVARLDHFADTQDRATDYLGGDDEDVHGVDVWLSDYLEGMGPTASQAVKSAGAKVGFPERTVQRASKRLGVMIEYRSPQRSKDWDRQAPAPRLSFWSLPVRNG